MNELNNSVIKGGLFTVRSMMRTGISWQYSCILTRRSTGQVLSKYHLT